MAQFDELVLNIKFNEDVMKYLKMLSLLVVPNERRPAWICGECGFRYDVDPVRGCAVCDADKEKIIHMVRL